MFCYECGCRVEAIDKFCPQCGTPLDNVETQGQGAPKAAAHKYFDMATSKEAQPEMIAAGYILTHVYALAAHLHVRYDDVVEILNEFIALRSKSGVVYRIIDMSGYTDNPAEASWVDFQKVVTMHYMEDARGGIVPEYIFIIGGCDIVPMPQIPIKLYDNDVDSDFPYCFLYRDGTNMEQTIDLSILESDVSLLCGRLPLASDTTLQDFVRMLSNTLKAGQQGLFNMNLHVQSDPNWKKVTALVANDFQEYMPLRSEEDDFFYGPVMLTPELQPGTEAFDAHFPYRQASVFYYNLHGTNQPGIDCFAGQEFNHGAFKTALHPQNIAAVTHPNMVLTEACYGGWFRFSERQRKSKQKHETILLSAMHAGTVCYVGSSRVAWGTIDKSLENGANPTCADVFAAIFLQSVYSGIPAGVALWQAREFFRCRHLSPTEIVTLFEFNLFGDPALSAVVRPEERRCKWCKSALMNAETLRQSKYEVEYDSAKNQGILGYVRSLVDGSLQEINSMITKHLYDVYGVEPRRLNRVLGNKTGNGGCKYAYCYTADNGEWVVGVDGQTRQVLYTVCSK